MFKSEQWLPFGLGIINTTETALAANKLPLEIFGQTAKPFVAECITKNGNKMLHLGIVLVIANLGVSCIIGEPGKTRNNIICLPKQKIILLASENDVHQVPYAPRVHKTVQPSSEQNSNFSNLPHLTGKYESYFAINEVFFYSNQDTIN